VTEKRTKSSDNHPTIVAMRAKFESIQDTTLPAIEALVQELEKVAESTAPPAAAEDEIHVEHAEPEKEEP
jgi:hypothetical protein